MEVMNKVVQVGEPQSGPVHKELQGGLRGLGAPDLRGKRGEWEEVVRDGICWVVSFALIPRLIYQNCQHNTAIQCLNAIDCSIIL